MDDFETRGKKEVVNGFEVDQMGAHINTSALENALTKIAAGEQVDVEGEKVTNGEVVEDEGFVVDEKGVHFDLSSLASSLASSGSMPPMQVKTAGKNKKKAEAIDFGVYQPIWEELKKIPFSKETYEDDIKMLANAIKEASRELKVRRIVANTQALAKNAQNFYYSDGGMRTVFSILGNRFSMAVKGELTGMEAFYIQVNGDSLDGIVLRKDEEGNYSDATKDFQVFIKREK